MDKKFVIFDMDGTLVDSMGCWTQLAEEYLHRKGISSISEEVREKIKAMTIPESANLFMEEYHLPCSVQTVCDEMNALMESHYRCDIPLKPGVSDFLEMLHRQGVQMCVASATSAPLVEACLKRLGVSDYFEFLLSCEEVGAGKNSPDVYHQACGKLGACPADTAVYEDAVYAAKTAKEAGFYVVGVYEDSDKAHWNELVQLADEAILSF